MQKKKYIYIYLYSQLFSLFACQHFSHFCLFLSFPKQFKTQMKFKSSRSENSKSLELRKSNFWARIFLIRSSECALIKITAQSKQIHQPLERQLHNTQTQLICHRSTMRAAPNHREALYANSGSDFYLSN